MEQIGKHVERELSRGGAAGALALAEITSAWPGAVGDAVAREAWPLRVGRDGTLHVATTSATWAFELDRLSPEIGERLSTMLGDAAPRKLRFRVGPVPEPAAATAGISDSPAPPEVTAEVASEAASAAAAIDDPELRELAARAARASLSRARSGRSF